MNRALKEYLGAERGRQRRLAEALGVNESHISNIANGRREGSVDKMRRIAEITGLPLSELMGADPHDEMHDQATPYTPTPLARGTTLDAAVAPGVRQRQSFLVQTASPGLHILTGDVIVIDMRDIGAPGDIVLASVMDGDFRETRILRYLPPHLLSGDPTEPPVPEDTVRIQGKIVGLIRGLPT